MSGRKSLLLLLLLLSLFGGCVRRRLTVRSNPPGALVYIDDQEIGTTPVSTPFTYYGTRKIRLVKDGYETVTVHQTFPAPWYQVPGIDFISENLVPRETRDERIVDFEMQPQRIVPMQELLTRADELRGASLPTSGTPLPESAATTCQPWSGPDPASGGPYR